MRLMVLILNERFVARTAVENESGHAVYKFFNDITIRTNTLSTLATPLYGISKYLVDIIQPTLNENQHKVKNFVSQAQTWKIEPNEIQVSFDVTNLYPSIPIDKAIDVILQQLSEDYEDLKTRTKLTLVDIQQLIELCVSECYFLWDNVIWDLLNSGPIGFSIMIVLSESHLQNLEKMLLN